LREWLRRHRRLSLVLGAAVAILAAALAAALVFLATLPGVGDAESRVDAILARHGGRALAPPPPERLAIAVVSTEDENFYDNVFFNVASGSSPSSSTRTGAGSSGRSKRSASG
jgi:hypothetical protein